MKGLWVFYLLLFVSCGSKPEKKIQHHRAIYYGEPCSAEEFPSSVEIWADAKVEIEFLGLKHIEVPVCGGTVIGAKAVLTAAHCFKPETITHHWGELKEVHYGVGREDKMQNVKWASHWIQHEDYHPENPEEPGLWQQNDLAVLVFQEQLEIPIAHFLNKTQQAVIFKNRPVWIVGWGDQVSSAEPKRMCAKSHINELGEWEMQIGSEDKSPRKCFGDSGGATYVLLPNGEHSLIGVTSRSYDTKGCERGGVDTRVDQYVSWIDNKLNMIE